MTEESSSIGGRSGLKDNAGGRGGEESMMGDSARMIWYGTGLRRTRKEGLRMRFEGDRVGAASSGVSRITCFRSPSIPSDLGGGGKTSDAGTSSPSFLRRRSILASRALRFGEGGMGAGSAFR